MFLLSVLHFPLFCASRHERDKTQISVFLEMKLHDTMLLKVFDVRREQVKIV